MDWFRVYYQLSERFGWLPHQISKLTVEQVVGYMKEMARTDKLRTRIIRSRRKGK